MRPNGITKLGTQVRVPDGRVGTVVYNSLMGVGIKWGLHDPYPGDFEGTSGNTVTLLGGDEDKPRDFAWEPDALLRTPWPSCERYGFAPEDCVGEEEDCEILRIGRGEVDNG